MHAQFAGTKQFEQDHNLLICTCKTLQFYLFPIKKLNTYVHVYMYIKAYDKY